MRRTIGFSSLVLAALVAAAPLAGQTRAEAVHPGMAHHGRREIRRDHRELRQDRRELLRDRRELRQDRHELRRECREWR